MPEELLRSAVSAPAPRRWFMLPLSVAAHGAAVIVCFVIPLTAAGDLPIPGPPSGIVRFVKLMPPPMPVERPRTAHNATAAQRSRAVPTEAPSTIEPERPEPPSGPPGPPVDGALPGGPGVTGGFPDNLVTMPPPPAPPVPELRPVRPGGNIREPRKIVDVAPAYPRIAQDAKVEGVVILEAIIGIDGRVDRVRVLRSVTLLDEAAIAAVKEWRYTPTLLNGVPVPVLMTITVNFRLH